ncbi:hypothetical protein FEM48_Zijuj04G0013400 [Ziziphus jujuba var. spinosa]|uniref:Uncharacterized protein n=1 Tax=Ziziphus jujuba var. spinosa TaxID=714518 RepID=A0A978VH09_ZIZJJ|nr:hypothetical protein FEM48_Zijuj04G0013400 [Ziziphus jujuba var. spinosa]
MLSVEKAQNIVGIIGGISGGIQLALYVWYYKTTPKEDIDGVGTTSKEDIDGVGTTSKEDIDDVAKLAV